MSQVYSKNFSNYEDAYDLYSTIQSGGDPDRENPIITYQTGIFIVFWMKK